MRNLFVRVDNFPVENTADANITGPLNFKPKTMYHDMAEGSENLKDRSETTHIHWIRPKGLNKDSIEKMPPKLPGLLYSFVYHIRHILPIFYSLFYHLKGLNLFSGF